MVGYPLDYKPDLKIKFKMIRLKKTLYIIFGTLTLIGLAVGFIFVRQFTREGFKPSIGVSGKSMAVYPPPMATQTYIPLPTFTPKPTKTPTPTPIILENGWYLYIDKEAGYSFSYPPDAHFHTSKEGKLDYKSVHIQFDIPDANGYQGMMIEVLSNADKLPIESIAQKIYTTDLQSPSIDDVKKNSEQIKVAGMVAYQFTITHSFYEFSILSPNEDKVFFIVPVHDNLNLTVDPPALLLFFKILETFTLNP